MIRRFAVVAALVAAVPTAVAPLTAQAVIFGDEPKLDPMRIALKADVLVLRDTLYAVDATSARLVRAKVGNSPSVVVASARTLQSDCVRAARSALAMRKQMGTVGTNDPRGKAVIADYNKGLEDLHRAMLACDKSLQSALVANTGTVKDPEPFFRTALASSEAIKKYDWQLQVLLKTLQIPVDPKGFRSAINL